MLNQDEVVRALHHHWAHSGKEEDLAHEIYHHAAVLEFPQSGERFEGLENFREWRRRYPSKLRFHLRRVSHCHELVVTEYLISYDGNPWMFTVSIMEFEDEKVSRERIYITEGFEPPEWRAPWRSEQLADPPPPSS